MVACDVCRLIDDRPARATILIWQRQFAVMNLRSIHRHSLAYPFMAPEFAKGFPK